MTAAGRAPAANVLVIGAGVAGLAAIATAKEMGAAVRAFDTRLEVREQIESLGGESYIARVAPNLRMRLRDHWRNASGAGPTTFAAVATVAAPSLGFACSRLRTRSDA